MAKLCTPPLTSRCFSWQSFLAFPLSSLPRVSTSPAFPVYENVYTRIQTSGFCRLGSASSCSVSRYHLLQDSRHLLTRTAEERITGREKRHESLWCYLSQQQRRGRDAAPETILSPSLPVILPPTPQYEYRTQQFLLEASRVMLGLGLMAGTMMATAELAAAADTAAGVDAWTALVEAEPKNALSLPTWVIHVASVVEWVAAMGLAWQFGDTPGNAAWKGLSWGMVPLLGGAMCACTWHFFYNAQSLEVLVVMQSALTAAGNCTMWFAAYRIYQASQQESKAP